MNFFRRLRGSREARIAERMTDDMPRPKISAKLSSPSTTAESSPSPTSSSELRRQNSQSSETSDTTTSLVMPSARPPKRHSRNPTETRLTLAAKMTKRVNLLEAIDMSNFSPAYVEKSEASIAIIDEALQGNFIFTNLLDEDRRDFAMQMRPVMVRAGTPVIKQDDSTAEYFYAVESGAFSIEVNGEKVAEAREAESFGELALLYNSPRAATVRCVEDGKLWILDRHSFRHTLAKAMDDARAHIRDVLSRVDLLQPLDDEQIEAVADAMQKVSFSRGETIIHKGDEGHVFYILKQGVVRVTDIKDSDDIILEEGQYFGERALLTGDLRAATVRAESDVELLGLAREEFEIHIGPLSSLQDEQQRVAILDRITALSPLSQDDKLELALKFSEVRIDAGETVFEQGDEPDAFYIIKQGKIQVWQLENNSSGSIQIGELGEADYFGEAALINNDLRGATIIASDDADVWLLKLSKEDFESVVGTMAAVMEREVLLRAMEAKRHQEKAFARGLQLHELSEVSVLGAGTFGKVSLMHHPQSGMTFALKAINKSQIQRLRQERNIVNEKITLQECDHPFVLRLYKTFVDKSRVYLLTEFLQGGELFSIVHTPQYDGIPERNARFYAAATLLGLAHMHDKGFAYRDLKPENIMIDAVGYSKIIDMGFAKRVRGKTFTMCGTPEYLCPEIIMGVGHNRAVDYWALGVLIYEMIVGISPFCPPNGADQTQIMRNIINGRLKFPRGFPHGAVSLIKGTFTPCASEASLVRSS